MSDLLVGEALEDEILARISAYPQGIHCQALYKLINGASKIIGARDYWPALNRLEARQVVAISRNEKDKRQLVRLVAHLCPTCGK